MSRYRVTAPLVIVHDPDGAAHHRYEGQVISWPLTAEQHEHLLGKGMLEELSDLTPPGVVPADLVDAEPASGAEQQPADPGSAESPARPPQIAKKEVWVEWAVQAKGLDQATAEGMTLEALKAL